MSVHGCAGRTIAQTAHDTDTIASSTANIDMAVDPPNHNSVRGLVETDENLLQRLGYQQKFKRVFDQFDSFSVGFVPMTIFANMRTLFFLGVIAGGPLALWTSSLISAVFITITAAVLCEICSALPTSGSIYVWAAEAAGPKYGRFFAFITAWWAAAAWMAFPGAGAQFGATYLLSIPALYNLDFPGGISNDNVKWRAVVWIVSEALLFIGVAISCLPPHRYSLVLRTAMGVILLDMFLNTIWLPIGVSQTYGFRSAKETLLSTYNGTGAPAGWNWMLSFFTVMTATVGFEASAHIAEETNNARVVAARSVFASGVFVMVCQFVAIIIYLFCAPAPQVLFTLDAPQPFVLVYQLALGRGGATFMAVLSTLSYVFAIVANVMASSRLVFAIARDGVLPFGPWVQHVNPGDQRPRNAILLIYIYSSLLLCSVIPSSVAFSSLISIGCVPLSATYGLIGLLRLTMTPNGFRSTKYPLGLLAKPFYLVSAIFGAVMVAVLVSPLEFPVTGQDLNYAGVVFGAVTIFGLLSWWFIPEERWMRNERIKEMYEAAD